MLLRYLTCRRNRVNKKVIQQQNISGTATILNGLLIVLSLEAIRSDIIQPNLRDTATSWRESSPTFQELNPSHFQGATDDGDGQSVPKTSENFHAMKRLSVRGIFY